MTRLSRQQRQALAILAKRPINYNNVWYTHHLRQQTLDSLITRGMAILTQRHTPKGRLYRAVEATAYGTVLHYLLPRREV